MSTEMIAQAGTNGRSFLQKAGDWLFQQGVSTVLLVGIFVAIWRGGPALVREVREALRDESASHKAEVKDLGDTFKWALNRIAPPPAPQQLQPGGSD